MQEHVPAIYLLLSCKNSRACADVSVASLNSESDLKTLLSIIKKHHGMYQHSLAYIQYGMQ